jgi:spore maturation protein CgeB
VEIRYFAHSWVSDWNHGNAHFLRGLARALMHVGHKVRCYEQLGSWSLSSLVQTEGERAIAAIDGFRQKFPELDVRFYEESPALRDALAPELRGADVVIVHEWNHPAVTNTILGLKQQLGFLALYHDTHHRAYTNPRAILEVHLPLFDGVLAFGEAIRRIYSDGFGMHNVFTFHEAADISNFQPQTAERQFDVLWIGNWGDDERTRELQEFLVGPAKALPNHKFVVHGVRYPEQALSSLKSAGIEFRGYVPNLETPRAYGQSAVSLHVPRRQYANGLGGIPTIRVFEALACGVPLVCSPWQDVEGLFRPGEDYICVPGGIAMKAELERLLSDDAARRQLGMNGLETIRARHTCEHRARQLTEICQEIAR